MKRNDSDIIVLKEKVDDCITIIKDALIAKKMLYCNIIDKNTSSFFTNAPRTTVQNVLDITKRIDIERETAIEECLLVHNGVWVYWENQIEKEFVVLLKDYTTKF